MASNLLSILLVIFIFFIFCGCADDSCNIVAVPGELPYFKVLDIEGNLLSDESYRSGTTLVILCDSYPDYQVINYIIDIEDTYNVTINKIVVSCKYIHIKYSITTICNTRLFNVLMNSCSDNSVMLYHDSKLMFKTAINDINYDDFKLYLLRSLFNVKNIY